MQKRGNERDAVQVVANGGVATLAALGMASAAAGDDAGPSSPAHEADPAEATSPDDAAEPPTDAPAEEAAPQTEQEDHAK